MQPPPFSWTCPYCGQPATVTEVNCDQGSVSLNITRKASSDFTVFVNAISCPNPDCEEPTLTTSFWANGKRSNAKGLTYWGAKNKLYEWPLLPRSLAKPMPEYIPEEIRKNYEEACLIQNDSPKASAAMSRRCLQGIVRDFWDIPSQKRGNLGSEIKFIEDKIDNDTFESIKAVREVGDIGAHMEKSVDTIVDVEPEEAALLIELIETLISDWYISKHRRTERNRNLQETVSAKRAAKKLSKETSKEIEDQSKN